MLDFEPFVDAHRAAEFLSLRPRRILELARSAQIPAHPIGTGKRKQWRFKLSELTASVGTKTTIIGGSPLAPKGKKQNGA